MDGTEHINGFSNAPSTLMLFPRFLWLSDVKGWSCTAPHRWSSKDQNMDVKRINWKERYLEKTHYCFWCSSSGIFQKCKAGLWEKQDPANQCCQSASYSEPWDLTAYKYNTPATISDFTMQRFSVLFLFDPPFSDLKCLRITDVMFVALSNKQVDSHGVVFLCCYYCHPVKSNQIRHKHRPDTRNWSVGISV